MIECSLTTKYTDIRLSKAVEIQKHILELPDRQYPYERWAQCRTNYSEASTHLILTGSEEQPPGIQILNHGRATR